MINWKTDWPILGVGLAALGIFWATAGTHKKSKDSEDSEDPKDPDESPNMPPTPSIPHGWRRAKQDEVTERMQEIAQESINYELPYGTVIDHGQWAVFSEPHHDAPRGWHRGITVLMKG